MLSESWELRYNFYWRIAGWFYLAVIVYLSLTPDPPSISDLSNVDKIEHLATYGLLMSWFAQLYAGLKQQLVWAILFCLFGIVLEFVQGWGGHRFFDAADMAANTLGVLLGWWLTRTVFAGLLLRVDQ